MDAMVEEGEFIFVAIFVFFQMIRFKLDNLGRHVFFYKHSHNPLK